MIVSLGIDPSTAGTGFVVLSSKKDDKLPTLLHEECASFKKMDGFRRVDAITERMLDILARFTPQVVVIEGYGLNFHNAASVIPMVTLGAILRRWLIQTENPYLEPRPTELKKFICGNGGAQKAMVVMHVLKNWDHEAFDNNTADAYGLACFGLAHHLTLPWVRPHQKVLAQTMQPTVNRIW